MTPGYRLSSLAETDVASIVEYIAAYNLDAALRFVDRLTDPFGLLAVQPELGEIYGEPERRVRRMVVDSYIVFYQHLDEEVLIVRVLHGARQWEKLI
jgi:toxin ParE1/3/4